VIELENISTSNSNGIQRGIIQLTSLPILLDVVVIVLSSIVVLTPNDNFWVLLLLHSANVKTLKKNNYPHRQLEQSNNSSIPRTNLGHRIYHFIASSIECIDTSLN